MQWFEVKVYTSEEATEAVSHYLQELNSKGVAIEEEKSEDTIIIKAYFPEWMERDGLRKKIQSHIAQLHGYGLHAEPGIVEINLIDESSWENEWKRYFKPIRITDRLTVKPLWEEYNPVSSSEKIIELEPGMAFGTGTHPTTNLCMGLLEKHLLSGNKVIDVGCGSGILSIAAAKLGAKKVTAVDSDPIAVRVARQNCELNHVHESVVVCEGDLLKGITETAHLVVANILAEVICRFTHDLTRVLSPGGIFIASGIIQEKEDEVLQSITEFGLTPLETVRQGNWVAMVAKKW